MASNGEGITVLCLPFMFVHGPYTEIPEIKILIYLLICSLFNDACSIWEYIALNERLVNG
jgi:hypothetical protein